MTDGNLRVLYYCHDTYGLGHITRSLTLAGHLADEWAGSSHLIVTGSPLAHELELPPRTDYVKLPSVVKTGARQYEARSLGTDFASVHQMRAQLLVSAARTFRPDIAIVDHAPAGMMGDAVTALLALKSESPRTRLVLGLRDIVDAPELAIAEWNSSGAVQLMEDVYDLILVYGSRAVCDIAREYRLSPRIQAKIRYVGYLGRAARSSPPRRRIPQVLVTAGGGGDGFSLMRQYLADLNEVYPDGAAPFTSAVVTGPFMDLAQVADLRAMAQPAASWRRASVKTYVPALSRTLSQADLVVSMAGYNTTCEILTYGRPAILVPRVRPRQEQLIRARALARRGLVGMVHPDELVPGRLMHEVHRTLATPARPYRPVDQDGLPNAAHQLELLIQQSQRHMLATSFIRS